MDQATDLRRRLKEESLKIHKMGEERQEKILSYPNGPRVISVTSGKGGVGKTNVVGNLAISFQRTGKRVLIFDGDLGLANMDIIFGLSPAQNIEGVIRGEKDLSQIIIQGPEGVSVIPSSSGIQDLTHLTEGQKIHLLNEFDMLNHEYDILLIDTGAGISSNVIYFNLAAQERIIVVTPEPTSVTDAYALIKVMFNQHGTKHYSLLLNMVKGEEEAKSVYAHLSKVAARFMKGISIDYAGFIPWDPLLQEAVSRRRPVTCSYPESPSSQGFETLAHYILSQSHERWMDGNIKFFWKSLLTQKTDKNNENRNQ